MKLNRNTLAVLLLVSVLVLSLTACATGVAGQTEARPDTDAAQTASAQTDSQNDAQVNTQADAEANSQTNTQATQNTQTTQAAQSGTQSEEITAANVTSDGAIDASDLFSKRDLTQTADLSEAISYTVSDGNDLHITAAGVYLLQGSAKNVTIYVEAGDEDKVQLVLNGLEVANDSFPVIYGKNADKVFLTTAADSENHLSVTGAFTADGSTNTDAVVFSRDDLVLNGLGALNIVSSDNGISCKDKLKLTGGTLTVSAQGHGLEANDGIAVAAGVVSIAARQDGLHAENDDDTRLGWIYLCGGTLTVNAADDGLHAVSIVQIDGGTLSVTAAEGIEGTWVQLNDGTVTVSASDDGINGARKSTAYTTCVELNGGTLEITMGQGDTDAVDSNGNLVITGGVITISAQSPFDYDGTLTHTGGTITVNGVRTDTITNQFGGMGPGRRGR